jgi:signal transduction histidine kinase
MENVTKFNILIVDDKPANLLAQQALLAKKDRVLYTARNGNEALKLALSNPPDLILLDVHMPDMDGFEVARLMRQNKRTRDIPIIFVTAERKEHQSMVMGFEEGAIDYLFKPLDPEITKAKVSVLLNMQLQKKELSEKNKALEQANQQIKKLNEELQKNIRSLEVANKELDAFSYSVSHDLRTPLRTIDAFSGIMIQEHADKLDDEGKRVLDIIVSNAKKMMEMIDKLLEFSRLGKKTIRKEKISMKKLVDSCIQDVRRLRHNAVIKVGKLPVTEGDSLLLSYTWANLISNAVKYSGKKAEPKIEIGSHDEQGTIVYYVKDNGAGFDMAYADKLFKVFQRLHSADDFKGIGVGLALVQRIIAKHGGKIWAEGELDKGATFYFTLPDPR